VAGRKKNVGFERTSSSGCHFNRSSRGDGLFYRLLNVCEIGPKHRSSLFDERPNDTTGALGRVEYKLNRCRIGFIVFE
jgi:hypothetical protein